MPPVGSTTSIEWTDASWNPVRGCTKVSEGCRNCWAMRMAARFSKPGMWGHGFAEMVGGQPRWTGRVELIPAMLDLPLRWSKPSRVFLSSFDLFHESLPDHAIDSVFAVMAVGASDLRHCRARDCDHEPCSEGLPTFARHTYQVLTKRPERMQRYVSAPGVQDRIAEALDNLGWGWSSDAAEGLCEAWPLPNVWLGTSVEDQATADTRIPLLLQTPAAVRFVSYEPALGPVDFTRWTTKRSDGAWLCCECCLGDRCDDDRHCDRRSCHVCKSSGALPAGLDWIIAGGESGPGARPFDVAWARSTIARCRAAGVACFVKQVGAEPRETGGDHLYDWPEYDVAENCATRAGVSPAGGQWWAIPLRDRKGGDMEEWPEDLRVREFPAPPAGRS